MRRLRRLALGLLTGVVLLATPAGQVATPDAVLVAGDGGREAHAVGHRPHVVWILAVGSDARPGQGMLQARGDALQLVGLNARTGAATAIGIPRDSYVSIPGRGRDKINASLAYGGPGALSGAVANLVGIRPDYVFVTRFPLFEDLVDWLGGIRVFNPRAFSDPNLRPKGLDQGWIRLNGYDAMAFSRIRKGLPGGDFARSANQQRTLRGIHRAIRARAEEPGFLERGALQVMRRTSTRLGPAALFRLAHAVARVEPGKVTTCVVPGRTGRAGGSSVVFPNVARARSWADRARADATLSGC